MKLSLGFSPCPNDTFIFDALVHQKIETEGLTFEVIMEDVEALNQAAFRQELDITKLSYHAYAYLRNAYALLDAGSALGNNCGPLLIARQPMLVEAIKEATVAIPGKYTTANFLLGLAYPEIREKKEMLFSDIEDAVLQGRVDAGLIIHENRFTYQDKGLIKIVDLGEYWESTTGMPIPLGGIVIKRSLPMEIQQRVNRVLARSVAYALDHPEQTMDFVRPYAQEMEESVMMAHIGLYVNNFTRNLGPSGRAAVQHLFDTAHEKGIIPESSTTLFITADD
ncbi:MAG: 1,4-dihydroxy-6-naphthoate synthase [Saprospiraceae bacterium]